jgi:hypothetical protein
MGKEIGKKAGKMRWVLRRLKACWATVVCAAVLGAFAWTGSAFAWGGDDESQGERPCYVKMKPKIVHRTFRRRILVIQGSYESVYKAPVYGEVVHSSIFGTGDREIEGAVVDDPASDNRVLLRRYRNIAIYHPAQYRWITERVAIQPEGYVWRRVSRHCH